MNNFERDEGSMGRKKQCLVKVSQLFLSETVATFALLMHNGNIEIWIAGSPDYLQ